MSATVKVNAKPVKPSIPMPTWVGILGLVMFCVGCLAAGLGISQNEPSPQAAVWSFSRSALSMANAYTGSVERTYFSESRSWNRKLRDRA